MSSGIGERVLVVGSTGAGKTVLARELRSPREAERWLASVPDRREGARD